jgi:hypothetical protein
MRTKILSAFWSVWYKVFDLLNYLDSKFEKKDGV